MEDGHGRSISLGVMCDLGGSDARPETVQRLKRRSAAMHCMSEVRLALFV